jgi:hypothetical protein
MDWKSRKKWFWFLEIKIRNNMAAIKYIDINEHGHPLKLMDSLDRNHPKNNEGTKLITRENWMENGFALKEIADNDLLGKK